MNLFRDIWNSQEIYPHFLSGKIRDENTLLILAGKYGFPLLVKYLIPRSDVNKWEARALRESAQFGQLESVELLLDNGADIHVGCHGLFSDRDDYIRIDHDAPLELAIENNQIEMANLLVRRGAHISDKSLLLAAKTGDIRMVKCLEFIFNDLTLKDGVFNNLDPEIFRFLLRTHFWPQYILNICLKEAVRFNRVELAELLINQGAKIGQINIRTPEMQDLLEDIT